jgi:hypothetical protein
MTNNMQLNGQHKATVKMVLNYQTTHSPHKYRPGDKIVVDLVRFEVFTAMTMKNGVFWDVTPYGSCSNRRFRGTWRLPFQGDKSR